MSEMAMDVPDNNSARNRKGKIALLIFLAILIIGAVVGFFTYRYKQTHVSTDDAFIEGTIYTISPKVSGTILEVPVKDNVAVTRGALLARINPERYEVILSQALATRESEEKNLIEAEKAVDAARAKVHLSDAELAQARMDFNRAKNLRASGSIPESEFDRAKTAFSVARASKAATDGELASRISSLGTIKARIKRARSLVDEARLNIKYTYVKAPGNGYVTRKNVEVGNFVTKGQPLMAVVSTHDLWIVANFKETQIEHMKVSDKVEIRVDTYEGRKFEGKVDSFMAGTGSAFSLFPPENATGNYVKVVQRVPVKILFTEPIPGDVNLRVGMSVVPTVMVSR